MTKLLVSVRNAAEARAAIDGGADIVDVKEPTRGSLGMADLNAIADVVRAVRSTSVPACVEHDSPHPNPLPKGEGATRCPISAALGETRDWLLRNPVSSRNRVSTAHQLPDGLTYAKLGLAGLASCGDWQRQWQEVRKLIDANSAGNHRWIAVAYVDWQSAEAPPPTEVIEAAADSECVGVLFDTFHKDNRGLLNWLEKPELTQLIELIHNAGMLAALAGGLTREDAATLSGTAADVLAIRTAACEDGRNGTVTTSAVRAFRAAMDAAKSSTVRQPGAHPAN